MEDATHAAAAPATDFPIDWEEGDEELEWEWDEMHLPHALPALSQDYIRALLDGVGYRYRAMGLPARMLTRVWNGYGFMAFKLDAPPEQHEELLAGATDGRRGLIPGTRAYWARTLPELQAMYAEIEAMTAQEPPATLAEAWARAWTCVERAWQIHFYVIAGAYQVLDDLADRYEAVVDGGSAAEAFELVAGAIPELHDIEVELEALTAAAVSMPEVASRLQTVPAAGLAEIAALPGGPAFVVALEDFLTRHGHLGHVSEDLMDGSWRDDPRPLIADIGRRVGRPSAPAAERWAARAEAADARADAVRSLLADRPADLAEFNRLLATAREIGPLTEGHNYWIDRMAADHLRRFTRRVGRRLVRDGVLGDPEDVAYLHRSEIAELIGTPVDRRALIEERRARHAAQSGIRPPRKVGKVEEPAPDAKADRFDGARYDPIDSRTLKGTGASAGTVRGRARVVFGAADFERVDAGDIVVATASNPGWVPLFAIAGGFVTDSGGVLSHAAVVAREFGLPAVVGTGDATRRITDGEFISIDGTSGLVTLG